MKTRSEDIFCFLRLQLTKPPSPSLFVGPAFSAAAAKDDCLPPPRRLGHPPEVCQTENSEIKIDKINNGSNDLTLANAFMAT